MEQSHPTTEALADTLAIFRRRLLHGRVPPDAADELTADLNRSLLQSDDLWASLMKDAQS